MPPKKTAKTSEAKKPAETKTKKTTKTTKAATKTKATPRTKKTATKKKVVEEETPVTELEGTTESEPVSEDVVEKTQQTEESLEEPPTEGTSPAVGENNAEEAKESVDDEKINAHRIFITRIPFDATKDDLEEYFKKFGTVYDAYCPKQSNYSTLNKGFGFISFDSEETIQKVFETSPHVIMGREVIVDRATGTKFHTGAGAGNANGSAAGANQLKRPPPPPPRRYREYQDNHRFKRHFESHMEYPNKYPRRDRHYDRDVYNHNIPPYRQNSATFDPNKSVSYVFSASRTENRNHEQYRTYQSTPKTRERNAPKLFVGRIGYDTTVQTLRSYFSQFGDVVDVYIPRDAQTQKSKGFGFLTFANKNSIHTVLDPSLKHVLEGRDIIVDYAEANNRRM
ncbi:DAZ-associated protein 1 [Theileria orientalis strain Shintoku]|uniref:DAZ-associated protein 1 n=1 Tax=Theileria orientalis strain Shintoku TaxID=869250 RepID=J4D8W7_THEOR|nr:DAZ-associated protein 1 [Theileria orientalis strain Shintoku]BAM41050.1 DAZ-associated protein 1 [Theileria orientalis strain Shintoku]|eukprot:XP_009691351.1 DAZ-associated protein 1 [Theileria orientalis strain Shintoku]